MPRDRLRKKKKKKKTVDYRLAADAKYLEITSTSNSVNSEMRMLADISALFVEEYWHIFAGF